MDPEETQSEAGGWRKSTTASIGSMSFMDTRSEPPLSMTDKLLLKKLRGDKKSTTVVPVDAPLTNSKQAPSSSSTTSSVVSETRSVTTSSKNAFKLDRKLTQASQVSVGGGSGGGAASSSRRSKQSRNSSGVAVVKKAPSLLSLPTTTSSTKSSSKKHERSSSVKSNTTKKTWSTVSSKEEHSSSSTTQLELALVVPSPVTNDPPTYECYGFHDSTTKGYDNDTTYYSSAYSSSYHDMPKKVIAVIGDEDTLLDTISESITESDEGTGSGRELVVVRTEKYNNDKQQHHALVEYEESTTSQSTNTDDDGAERGALVSAFKSNYLAAAVDNYGAIVPFDSEIYEPYDHTFISCPEYLQFRFLYTFLKKNLDKKIIIFYSTTESAVFHSKLLSRFNIPKVMMMHGQQKQTKFINTFFKFSDMEDGILCMTDSAGRDLDIPPSVDYVLQFEPPDDPSEYILRIGRVSCDSDRVGRSILFLNPGETNGFLKYYDSASIPVSEFEVPKLLAEIQSNIERLVNNDGDERMLQYAKDAFGAYLLAYASHGFRDVYNVHDLNKDDVASAFGLLSIPGDDDDEDDDSTSFYASGSSSSKRSDTSTQKMAHRKSTKKTWMKGNKKTWPHCRVRVHPMFKNDNVQTEIDSNE